MKKLNVYYHAYCVNDCYERFMRSYNKMLNSGLVEECTNINVVLVGQNKDKVYNQISELPKIRCHLKDVSTGETETLHLLWEDAQNDPNFYGFYLHSKGVSHGTNANIESWVQYMEYFCIEQYKACIEMLQTHDTVGVNLQKDPLWHYSGNFWWANSNYIKTLEKLDVNKSSNPCFFSERWYCEFWLFDKKQAKACSLHQSDVNHYCSIYSQEKYLK